jgi:hypothetical protein
MQFLTWLLRRGDEPGFVAMLRFPGLCFRISSGSHAALVMGGVSQGADPGADSESFLAFGDLSWCGLCLLA